MNNNIRDLAEQAGWMMGDEVAGFNCRLEKFAELLVLECVQLLGLESDYGKQHILKHFGVEMTKDEPTRATCRVGQRVPLTEEQIIAALKSISFNEMTGFNIARAVERAHGIGDNT